MRLEAGLCCERGGLSLVHGPKKHPSWFLVRMRELMRSPMYIHIHIYIYISVYTYYIYICIYIYLQRYIYIYMCSRPPPPPMIHVSASKQMDLGRRGGYELATKTPTGPIKTYIISSQAGHLHQQGRKIPEKIMLF